MAKIRNIIRILEALIYTIMELGLIFVSWSMLLAIFDSFNIFTESLYLYYAWNAYAILGTLIVVRNSIHRIKWYVRTNPANVRCTKCNHIISATRYNENRYLNAPFAILIFDFSFTKKLIYFYKIAYRPYLQLECPECGEKQVICPYCHEPIPQESVMTLYDKPSKCPHCGKKIYTPVPLYDSDKYKNRKFI